MLQKNNRGYSIYIYFNARKLMTTLKNISRNANQSEESIKLVGQIGYWSSQYHTFNSSQVKSTEIQSRRNQGLERDSSMRTSYQCEEHKRPVTLQLHDEVYLESCQRIIKTYLANLVANMDEIWWSYVIITTCSSRKNSDCCVRNHWWWR